eukprot:XP_002937250.3 PREDICTED: eukaryotic translation initiation factor 2 subunit 1-like [Xenopus tropicalis]
MGYCPALPKNLTNPIAPPSPHTPGVPAGLSYSWQYCNTMASRGHGSSTLPPKSSSYREVSKMHMLSGRFYKNQQPNVDDVVMVKVLAIFEHGAYVMLLEYNCIKAMIYLKELSTTRIHSIGRILRVRRKACLRVIKVAKDTGYINLSKRSVTPEQVKKCEDKYKKSETVFRILFRVARVLGYTEDKQLESLCRRTAWVFDDRYNCPGYGAYAAFKHSVFDPSVLDGLTLNERERRVLTNTIKRRLVPPVVKIQADVEVACYRYEGIDAVKDALRAGLSCSTENMPIKINLIASPCYAITTITQRRWEGTSALNQAIQAIKAKIEEKRGVFNVQMEPKVIAPTVELQLAQLFERLQTENARG